MMHSVLITNPEGKILLSRYFETQNDGSDNAYEYDGDAAGYAAGSDNTLRKGGGSIMRDRAMAMCSSESEVLGQTRHLWTKGTAECPQVARAKVRRFVLFDRVAVVLAAMLQNPALCGVDVYTNTYWCMTNFICLRTSMMRVHRQQLLRVFSLLLVLWSCCSCWWYIVVVDVDVDVVSLVVGCRCLCCCS